MPYLVGILLAVAICSLGVLVGFDRDRAFYPVSLIVIASYYALFAIMGGSLRALGLETVFIGAFIVLSILGFKTTLWLVVAGLAGHGLFDFVHGHILTNPGVPSWWPAWCLSYDVTAAAYLAVLLTRSKIPARAG
jgi:hypothetical protein